MIKRSLLEEESEEEFRKRLKEEKKIIQDVVERINLKVFLFLFYFILYNTQHPSFTSAYNAFTLKQTPVFLFFFFFFFYLILCLSDYHWINSKLKLLDLIYLQKHHTWILL
jgi:hypothetical protein